MNLLRTYGIPLAAGLLVAVTAHAVTDPAALDSFLLNRLSQDGIPGLSVAIIEKGRISTVRAFGEAGRGRPMRVNTPIAAASLMKSITATCVMPLVDAGQVALDAPGAAFHYFNPNYDLLARIVEVQSGLQFQDYVERFMFTPLGMHSSAVRPTMQALRRAVAESGQPLAQGHVEAFGLAVAMNEGDGYLGGAGGLLTTAGDMARWLAFQAGNGAVGGHRIVSAEGMSRLHAPAYGQPYAMG